MGSFRPGAGNQHLHWYFNFTGCIVETVLKSLRLSCGSEPVSYTHLDVYKRQIDFRPNREIGNEVLTVEGITKTIDGVKEMCIRDRCYIYITVAHSDLCKALLANFLTRSCELANLTDRCV